MINVFIAIIICTIYFLPWIVALVRGHKHTTAIFILNLCLGWTGIFWVAALIWSVIKVKE